MVTSPFRVIRAEFTAVERRSFLRHAGRLHITLVRACPTDNKLNI